MSCFSSLPGTRSAHAHSSIPGTGCLGMSSSGRSVSYPRVSRSRWAAVRTTRNSPLMGTGWVSAEQAQEQADKWRSACRVSGTSGRDVDVRTQNFKPGTQAPLVRGLELIPQQQQRQQQLQDKGEQQQQLLMELPQQQVQEEEQVSHDELQNNMAHEVFGKDFRKLTLSERQSTSKILSSLQNQAQEGAWEEVNKSSQDDLEAERRAAAQELYGKSWSELTTREKQSLATKLLHARRYAGSKRAHKRAIQQQKDSLALAHYGKPFRELGLREKHMLGRLWKEDSRAAMFPPGMSSKEEEEQLQQLRLQYLEHQQQQQQEREEHEAMWQQERDALSRQRYGKGWKDLPEQARHSVRSLMMHRHKREDLLPAGLKAQEAAKAQQLQAIAAERLGKDYDSLSTEEKRSIVHIWRWGNPLEVLDMPEESQEQPQMKMRDNQHQQQQAKGNEEKERQYHHQQQQQQQQQLGRDKDEKKRDQEEVAVAVLGRPWDSLEIRERNMISAHLMHARRRDENNPASEGVDRLAAIKDHIRQVLVEQHENQRLRESLAMQWHGKPWDSLASRERKSLSARMRKAISEAKKQREKPGSPAIVGQAPVHTQGTQTPVPVGGSRDPLFHQHSQSLPLVSLQQQDQQQQLQAKEELAVDVFGQPWDSLAIGERRTISAHLMHAQRRDKDYPASEDGVDRLAALKDHIRRVLVEQQENQRLRESLAMQWHGKPWDSLASRERKSLSARMRDAISETKQQGKKLGTPALLGQAPVHTQGAQTPVPVGGSRDPLFHQHSQSLPLAETQQHQQQQLQKDEDEGKRDQEEVAVAVLGRPWDNLEIREKQMIAAHLMHARRRDKDNPASEEGVDRLARVKDHIKQVLAQQQEEKEDKESFAMQWFGKPYDSLTSSERRSVRGRMFKAREQGEKPDSRSSAIRPLAILQQEQQQQQQQEREELAVSVFGQPWENLDLGKRRTILAHLQHAQKRDNGGVAPEDGRAWLEIIKDRIRQAQAEQQELQHRRESVAMQCFGKAWDSLTPSEKNSASVRMGHDAKGGLVKGTKRRNRKPAPPSDPEVERNRELLAQLFFHTTWDELSDQQRRAVVARLPYATPEYIQQQQEKLQNQQAKEAEAKRMFGQSWEDLPQPQKKSVASTLAWAKRQQAPPPGQEHAAPDATPPPATFATSTTRQRDTAGSSSATPVHVPQESKPKPEDAVAHGDRGKPRKPTASPAISATTTTKPSPALSSVPTDATSVTTALNAAESTNRDSSIPPIQDSKLMPDSAATVPTRRTRTQRTKPDLAAGGLSTSAGASGLYGPATPPESPKPPSTREMPTADSMAASTRKRTRASPSTIPSPPKQHAVVPPESSEPPSTPAVPTADPVAASARKRTRASPTTTPSSPPEHATTAGGARPRSDKWVSLLQGEDESKDVGGGAQSPLVPQRTITPSPTPQHAAAAVGASSGRGKRIQGEDESKAVGDGAQSPSTPQPANIPAMLQSLKGMQALGAKIRQVLDRLEGSRPQYERLPPERAAEKQRHFESIKSARASLDEVARLEKQILTGIQQSRQSNGR